MVFVYIRIYYAAKARARRGIRKVPRRPGHDAQTSFTNTPINTKNGGEGTPAGGSIVDRNSNNSPRGPGPDRQIATIEAAGGGGGAGPPPPPVIPTVTCDLVSDVSTSDAGDAGLSVAEQEQIKDTLKVYASSAAGAGAPRVGLSACGFRGSTLSVNGELQQQAAALARQRAPSVGVDADMVSEFDPSSSDSGVVTAQCSAVKPLKSRLCKPIFGRGRTSKAPSRKPPKVSADGADGRSGSERVTVPRVQKPKDPEREKRRIARKKEKRATLILGLIMGSFIACWLPFFCMYVLRLMFDVPSIAFSTAFWLGYMNSALNPVIYTIFNKDFRRAFRRILFK